MASLTKIWRNIFKKDVITFLIIRRHDLGIVDEKLRYIAVKPTASISVLRQKVWHLLDLPDFCEEVIILKANDREISLTELCKGNDPMHPYVMEVWLPGNSPASNVPYNMLTMGKHNDFSGDGQTISIADSITTESRKSNEPINMTRVGDSPNNIGYRKSNLSCKLSSSSVFLKLSGKKSKDSFTTMLMKIQHDLCYLGDKLSDIENRLPS